MCCSCANLVPLLRDVDPVDDNNLERSKLNQPIFYTNGYSQPLFPVITNEDPNHVQFFHWGLIPSFCRTLELAQQMQKRTINARAETIFTKKSFKESALYKRCIIPVSGFFEWFDYQGKKYPFYITMKKVSDFALAGLWNRWRNPDSGEFISTFCIITTQANSLVARIHRKERMPVILNPANEKLWLSNHSSVQELQSLLVPYTGQLEAWPVQKISNVHKTEKTQSSILEPYFYPELEELHMNHLQSI